MEAGESTWIAWSEAFQTTQSRPRESAVRKARKTEHFKAGMLKAPNSTEKLTERLESHYI